MRRAVAGLLTGALAAAAGLPAAALADSPPPPRAERVIELASPLQSEGFNAQAWGWPDGSHAVYKLGIFDLASRFSTRAADGSWSAQTLELLDPKASSFLLDGSDDLSRQIVLEQQLLQVEGERESLVLHQTGAPPRPIATWEMSIDPAAPPRAVSYKGRSADARTLYLQGGPASPLGSGSPAGLYRWRDGELSPVVLQDGRPPECKGEVQLGAAFGGYVSLLQNGVSADGRTLFVATRACTTAATERLAPHVLVWRDGATLDVTVPVAGADEGASYVGNSRDGSQLLFTSRSRLEASDADGTNDLFSYDVPSGTLTRVTADLGGSDDAQVSGAVASPDGEHVWFLTARPLAGHGVAGRGNLFSWSEQDGLSYVTTTAGLFDVSLAAGPSGPSAEVSHDGSALVTTTAANLTPDAAGGTGKVYRFGADGSARCLSCLADGRAVTQPSRLGAGPGTSNAAWGAPSVSADGETIVFESEEALDPADRNGVRDVYLWRDGERSLLSTGTQPAESRAGGLSWDGRAVFFSSFGALLPGTRDTYEKLYVARLGEARPPVGPAPCEGDGCQGPAPAPPVPPTPASETFEGGGNVVPEAQRSFAPRWPGRAALRRFARDGHLTLVVEGENAGRVAVAAQARLNRAWSQAASAAASMRGGTAKVTLRLSRQARGALARRGSLRLRIVVRAQRVGGQRSAQFTLRAAPRRTAAARVVKG